jgi:mannose-6-phosphate isomerase-like protein (cupin superfamily)
MSKQKEEVKTINHAQASAAYNSGAFTKVPEVKKLWGSEFHIHNDEKYCAKAMFIVPGAKCSVHFHRVKKESFTLCSGELIVEITNLTTGLANKFHLKNVGDSITIEPNTPHTFYTPEDQVGPSWFVESSSQDFDYDSYRITQSTGPTTNNR